MGAQLSNIFRKNDEDELEEGLRKYNEEMDRGGGGTYIGAKEDKQKVKWWERLIYDKRVRIAYVFILGVILGIVIPVIIFATKLEKINKPIYGSCLIKDNARFQCLINSEEPITEEKCASALCCWENRNDLSFKCYHSFPSAYQYNVSKTSQINNISINSESNDLEMVSSHPDLMSPIRVLTHWESLEHLVVEIFNKDIFPDRESPKNKLKNGKQKVNQEEEEELPFTVDLGQDKNFFFIRIGRRETDETIFDTRLGPVYATGKDITLATVLPTKYFYGLKGGQGSIADSTITYGIVNGFENSEFPFYISFESSGLWHGVLIDTTSPILAQVVQAPGIMLHLESHRPEINLHFFAGPTQPQILAQLHSYIREKHEIAIDHPPMIPPYWGLGLHLCRKLSNSSLVIQHIEKLLQRSFVFDSDCIDEDLRNPIYVDESQFPPNVTKEIIRLLLQDDPEEEESSPPKRILLSQKSTVPTPPLPEEPEEDIENEAIVIFQEDFNYFKDLLILDTRNSSNVIPFIGQIGINSSVNYIDYFNNHFLQNEFPPVPLQPNETDTDPETMTEEPLPLPYHGFSLDNFPQLDQSSDPDADICPPPETILQSYFTTRQLSSSDGSFNISSIWGTLCPLITQHNLTENLQNHLALHNVYGEQSLKIVYETVKKRQQEALSPLSSTPSQEMLLSSSSFWTGSLYYGAYNGMQAPFTWKGLQESVENTVRNYALAPVSGTPICGAILENNATIEKNYELCLRWFQFGLLLPFARNSYDSMSSYGPPDLSDQFLEHLNETVKNRYTYAPYYYTQLLKYQTTYVPLIRPMSLDFSEPHERYNTLPLLTQFMIGDALFAAPIIDRGVSRSAYFPGGVWYTMEGEEAWTNLEAGEMKQITGFLTQTPMFIRGGYMIPILRNPQGLSIEETLQGNYTLLSALSSSSSPIRTAYGFLTINEPASTNIHHVNFTTTVNTTETGSFDFMIITINSVCGLPEETIINPTVSTVIDQVRVFGLGFLGAIDIAVRSSDDGVIGTGSFQYLGEHSALRIFNLGINWCEDNYEITVSQKKEEENR